MNINLIELYYVKIPLEKRKPGFFSQPAYFNPSWIPGFRQSEMRFYFLKLGTDQGIEGYSAMSAMGPERKGVGPMMGNYLMGINPLLHNSQFRCLLFRRLMCMNLLLILYIGTSFKIIN